LEDKSFLDLGTGSGILALYAANNGATVVASDISVQAIEITIYNARLNNINLKTIRSDLFDNITPQTFEIIVINPPYYPNNPQNENDYAWYCGEGFEYYHKLFKQIRPYLPANALAVMSLADTCDINKIQLIAENYGYRLELLAQKNYLWEKQFTFRIMEK
jgi:release factor glutamine methyltransferase